ncbi:MAG TPA: hypothetical protein VKT81_17440 [Bryobacteraceae bacterium]|nr:hypothetical protein [Bryobacteraceae bacterium]
MSKRLALFLAACTGLLVSNLQADDVAALPGYNSLGANVAVFGVNPLLSTSTFTAGDSTFILLPKPDGTKFYVVAKSTSNPVTSVDANFQNPKLLATFVTTPSAAAITPDGGKVVVAAGTLHIFETVKDQEQVAGGINTGVNIFDVALSLDGKTAYALGTTTAGGSQLNAIDLTTNTKANPVYGISGTATGVSVGPNGRVYVSTQNQVIELDPATLLPTTGGLIGVNALPGRLVFTPDGRYGLAVNNTPATGQAILFFDLNAHTLANFIPSQNAPNTVFDTLLPASNTTVFAYSSQTGALYQVNIAATGSSITIGTAATGGAPTTFIQGVAISNEIPFTGRTTAQYLFISAGNILYRVDLTVNQLTAQTGLPNQQFTSLEYLAPQPSTGPSAVLLAYGDKQTISPNGRSLPLVVRSLDTNGKVVSGVTITFSTNLGSVSPTSVTTGSNGFASTILTAPASNGTVTVTATDGKHPYGFIITVGTPTSANAGVISIVAGQGQLLRENVNTSIPGFGSPLLALVTDLNGKPLSNVPVTYKLISGTGTLFGGTSISNGTTATINTNSQGIASAAYLTSVVPLGLASNGAQITAQAPGTNVITFYETTYPTNTSFAPLVQFVAPQPGQTLTGPAGTTIPGAFQAIIVDGKGIPIPNVSIFACVPTAPTVGPGGVSSPGTCTVPPANTPNAFGTCKDPTGNGVLSDAHGKITCDLVLNGNVGTSPIGAQYGYAFDTIAYPLKITPGPPGKITIVQGNNQTGKPGAQLPNALVIQVSDSFGNVLSDYGPVSWQVLNTGVPATLQNTSNATNSAGSASTLVTLGSTVGTVIIQVTAGSASASFALTIASTAANIVPVSGDGQQTFVNTAFAAPLLVKVVDNQGNGVPGAPVTFQLGSGSATIATPNTNTDATGVASTVVTAGATAGNITITASSGGFSTTFHLTSGQMGPQNIVFLNGTSFQLQHGCQSPGCVAPGEIVTVQGGGFANGVVGVVSGLTILGPLQTTLAGISITFNGVPAPIFYVSNQNGVQSMTIQVPFETQTGNATVVLNAAGGGSATYTIPVVPYAPGVFTSTYGNQTIAVAVRSDGSYVSPTNPAQRGETIYVFATGLGQTSPAAATNTQGAGQLVTATVVVGLNNKGVPHTTVDYAPGLVGVYIVGVQVPLTTEAGPGQPFGLILVDPSGKYFAQSTKIPIQ